MLEDKRQFEGRREIHISKSKQYNPNNMYVVWRNGKDKEIIGNIIITRTILESVWDRFKDKLLTNGNKKPKFDDVLLETVVDTLNHEIMHLAIFDNEGLNTSMMYDFFIGGNISNHQGTITSGGSSIQYRRKTKFRDYLP